MRNPAFCICKNKDADQLRGNRAADQHLCLRFTDRIPLLPKSEISSLYQSSMTVQTGLCQAWSETPKTGFLTTRLKFSHEIIMSKNVIKNHLILEQQIWVHYRNSYLCSQLTESILCLMAVDRAITEDMVDDSSKLDVELWTRSTAGSCMYDMSRAAS